MDLSEERVYLKCEIGYMNIKRIPEIINVLCLASAGNGFAIGESRGIFL